MKAEDLYIFEPHMASALSQVDSITDEFVLKDLIYDLEKEVQKIESVTGKSRRTHLFNLEIMRLENRLSSLNPLWSSRKVLLSTDFTYAGQESK